MNAFITILLILLPTFLLLLRRRRVSKRLPAGSLGVPIIGQTLSFLGAMRTNQAEKWLEERISKYGPIWKVSLFGKPTIFISGQAANKFIFTNNDGKTLSNAKPKCMTELLGNRNLLEMSGKDHKRLRDALMMFLKPDSLKLYVGKMDRELREHLDMHWQGKEKVTALVGGMWSVPINVPFTSYNRSIRASKMAKKLVKDLIKEKKEKLKENKSSIHQDLIACLLSIRDQDDKNVVSEEEIVHNVMLLLIAGHDTTSVLLTFLVRLLASDPVVYETVVKEHEEIAKTKLAGEYVTWEDLGKMTHTWRAAMETLRLYPPSFGGFRVAATDIEYGGYLIPKGWQVFWASCMTHMNDSIFHEPSKFDPKRFENHTSVPPYTFVAFGAGPRICPGLEFAKIETLITIHYLVTRFTWKLCYTDNTFSRDPMPVPKEGLPILIKLKKPL